MAALDTVRDIAREERPLDKRLCEGAPTPAILLQIDRAMGFKAWSPVLSDSTAIKVGITINIL